MHLLLVVSVADMGRPEPLVLSFHEQTQSSPPTPSIHPCVGAPEAARAGCGRFSFQRPGALFPRRCPAARLARVLGSRLGPARRLLTLTQSGKKFLQEPSSALALLVWCLCLSMEDACWAQDPDGRVEGAGPRRLARSENEDGAAETGFVPAARVHAPGCGCERLCGPVCRPFRRTLSILACRERAAVPVPSRSHVSAV